MSSAKVTIAQQDRSAIVASLSGINVGTVINSKWGPITPYLVSSPTNLVNTYAKPDNTKGSSWNGAELLLANSDHVYITRAIHEDARYSALLVSGSVEPVDYNDYPAPDAKPDLVIKGISGGLGLNDIESYSFPTYTRDREFVNTNLRVTVPENDEGDGKIEVSGFTFKDGEDEVELQAGDFIAFAEKANDETPIYEIQDATVEKVREDIVVLESKLSGEAGDEVKKWVTPVLIKTTLHEVPIKVGEAAEFTVTLDANGNSYDDVVLGINFTDSTAVSKLEYYNEGSTNWVELEEGILSNIGDLSTLQSAIAGFAVAGIAVSGSRSTATLKFRVTFARATETEATIVLREQDNSLIDQAEYRVQASEGDGTTGGIISEPSDGGVSYSPAVYLIDNAEESTSIKVSNSDQILNGDFIYIEPSPLDEEDEEPEGASTAQGSTVRARVNEKQYLVRDGYFLDLGVLVEADDSTPIQWMKYGDTEQRDVLLIYAKYPGDYGNNIKVGIRHSKDYEGAFWVDVYFQGALEESYEVTRDKRLDGFGYQMFIEDKINGSSNYIMVKNNESIEASVIPPETDNGVWRQVNVDIFNKTNYQTIEDVVTEDVDITLASADGIDLGTRLKFGPDGEYEYKVTEIKGNTIVIDRGIEEIGTIPLGTYLYFFDPELNDHENGIYNGSQYYKFTQIPALQNYKIGDQYTISGNIGYVLDAGYNNTEGGFDGSAVTLYDVITAFQKMSSKEAYDISIFCDNGFAYPEVAQAIDQICQSRNVSHGFLSCDYQSETKADAVTAMVEYRNSTNLNTAFSSMFGGWCKVADTYNQTNVWVAPSVFGANAQSFVTRNYNTFTPSAGWVYGIISGLDITNKFDTTALDTLVDSQINPIRYREGYGLAIWGNETLYSSPSPLQLRSVAMLLILLKYGVEDYLERTLFKFNSEPTWSEVEGAIDVYIRDNLYTPGGLYAYQVSVQDIITDSDIDNRRMPVWIGIQPTMDIKTIPVTIGIFNKSVDISY